MLILAGVSINAIVGDDGIISKAQSTKYLMGIATLEEYLQQEYIEYFDNLDDYTNKIELLNDKLPNLLLTNSSTRKYIIFGGKAYYLINKASLPNEIKQALVGGDSTNTADFSKLYDVYGVTPDLKVYYVDKKSGTVYGNLESTAIDPNTKVSLLNNSSNAELNSIIQDSLKEIGVKVDKELGITVGNLSSLKTLTIDGASKNITSLKALSEIPALQELTLKNLTLDNLDGLENLSVLNYVYFYNCDINDYSKLATSYKLKNLYFHFISSMSEEVTNKQIRLLGDALKNATGITNLQYFGAFGVNLNSSMTYPWWYSYENGSSYSAYTSGTRSNLTDISGLNNFASNIKSTIQYFYLNNNKLTSISSLSGFTNIYQVLMMCNSNLTSLNGLENHTNLKYLAAHSCDITSLSGLSGTTKLDILTLQDNKNLGSLAGINQNTAITSILAHRCNLTDISAVANFKELKVLYLHTNANLQSVSSIANCTKLTRLYLANNNNMIASEVALLQSIFNGCGLNYSVPTKYYANMELLNSYNYSGYALTATSNEWKALKGKTNVTRLNLTGNTSLSNEELNNTLKTMTGLKYLSLNGVKNLTSIDWIKTVPNLIELDLRGTGVSSNTDISLLNSYSSKMVTLIIDNKDIRIADIENALVNITNNWTSGSLDSWIASGTAYARGPICLNSAYDFSPITKLTVWRCDQLSVNGSNYINLSNCNNMTYFRCYSNCSYKLPASVTQMHVGNGSPTLDLSLCNKLTQFYAENATGNKITSAIAGLPDDNVLEYLYTYICSNSYSTLDFLEEFNASHLKTLTMIGYSQYSNGLYDIKGLQYAPNITSLDLHYTSVSNLDGIQYLTKLESFSAYNQFSKISDLSYLSELTSLKSINLSGNKISSLQACSKLTNLETLKLSSNYITDLSPLTSLINNETTKLKTLNLSKNNLEEYSASGTDNIQILKNLKTAGTTSIDVSNNNFEDDPPEI